MICTYSLVEEKKNERVSYGIKAASSDGETIACYHDVFVDRDQAEALVRRCNDGELRSRHLRDVVFDAIG